jgi:hypothetical protein
MAVRRAALERDVRKGGPSAGRIPVLFIVGAARSGSTLVARAIGTNDGFCPLGELQFIWQRSFAENQLCGCGAPFHDCEFWERVSREAFGMPPADVDVADACRLKAELERKSRLASLLLEPPGRGRRPALVRYGDLIEVLYRAILQVSGGRVIVDSSKDPRHGLVLSRLGWVELHVVHLVRDPRAVAFSWRRSRPRPEIHWKRQDMTRQPVRASAARWTTHNAVAEVVCASAQSYCRISYEQFVSDPQAALERILEPYPSTSASPRRSWEGELELGASHSVSGNPMRFQRGRLPVTLDDEWRRSMPLRDRLSVAALTWPLLAHYGYRLRAGA